MYINKPKKGSEKTIRLIIIIIIVVHNYTNEQLYKYAKQNKSIWKVKIHKRWRHNILKMQ